MSKTSIDKMIQLNHVKFGYSDTEVLDEINLTINEGEYVVLTGENGSGKSTLMRLILGELKPDEGEIIIMDNDSKLKKQIGYVAQNGISKNQSFPATVEEIMVTGLYQELGLFHLPNRKHKKKIKDTLKEFGMDEFLKRRIAELSGGQQQRVALARMMIGEPEAILLDEPFSALDGYLKDVLQREMQDFLQDYPGDMILVTHSRDEAYKFCKELSVVDGGRILVTDETKRLFENPRMLEAAKLTGCKNFSAVQRLGEHEIYATDWKIKLHTAEKVAEDITHVGIRGHWIRPEDKPGENCLEVQVDEYIETTFEHQYMIRRKGEEAAAGLWWMRPKNSFREDPNRGLPKYLYLPPEHLMLLK